MQFTRAKILLSLPGCPARRNTQPTADFAAPTVKIKLGVPVIFAPKWTLSIAAKWTEADRNQKHYHFNLIKHKPESSQSDSVNLTSPSASIHRVSFQQFRSNLTIAKKILDAFDAEYQIGCVNYNLFFRVDQPIKVPNIQTKAKITSKKPDFQTFL